MTFVFFFLTQFIGSIFLFLLIFSSGISLVEQIVFFILSVSNGYAALMMIWQGQRGIYLTIGAGMLTLIVFWGLIIVGFPEKYGNNSNTATVAFIFGIPLTIYIMIMIIALSCVKKEDIALPEDSEPPPSVDERM